MSESKISWPRVIGALIAAVGFPLIYFQGINAEMEREDNVQYDVAVTVLGPIDYCIQPGWDFLELVKVIEKQNDLHDCKIEAIILNDDFTGVWDCKDRYHMHLSCPGIPIKVIKCPVQ